MTLRNTSSQSGVRPDTARAAARDAALLERLGARVRAEREASGMTRRELAARSALSERFLAMLETGRANVSVTRLSEIAAALETTAAELLTIEGARAASGLPVIALLGLRGAGKSAIGRAAAARLDVPFTELDALIAARAGTSLGPLFEIHGASYYRRLEREELERFFAERRGGIVATGGSVVTEHATFARLRAETVTIWLRAKPEDHWSRVVAQGDARPMANRSDAMNELRTLLRARRPLYELADYVVDTSALGFDRSVSRVVAIARRAAHVAA